jgi:pimeloyl-ACP methyl ester carboxylesterase
MRKFVSRSSFRFWIGISRQVIFAVDGWRYGTPSAIFDLTEVQKIESGERVLVGLLASPNAEPTAAILIFHGIGDRIEYWASAQQYLARRGISSLMFHYSGYANSTGATTPDNLAGDAHAAYAHLRQRVGSEVPIFLLGFSLGSGLAIEAARTMDPPPAGVVLAQPYTTLRHAAGEVVRPLRALRYLFPDLWQTVHSVGTRRYPLLVVYGDRDELFPIEMAQSIHEAAAKDSRWPAYLSIASGYSHNAIYISVPPPYWKPILDFIHSYTQSGQ